MPFRGGLPHLVKLALALVVLALASLHPAQAGDVPLPALTKGKGERCVEDTAVMRRDHMQMLGHQRDATVHEGIRTPQHSLKECITCHVTPGADGKPVTVADPKHFCRGCHDYAAVRPDCFECHASRPEPGKAASAAPKGDGSDVAQLRAYLKDAAQ